MSERKLHGPTPFFGRLLLSLIFIISGFGKIFGFQMAAEHLRSAGIELGTEVFIGIALCLEILGGLSVLLGWYTRIGVSLLILFLLTTTFVMHAFWTYSGAEQMEQAANFFKNLAVFGGLLYVFCYGPGKWSLDAIRAKRAKAK